MKILFSVGNFGFLRNFEPALRLFAEGGHDLHLVAERKDSVGGTRTLDLLLLTPLLYFGSQQVEYVRAARAQGIRTALGVGSWDHLTTKGLIHEAPRHVLVWNEAQRGEAHELHGIPPERVTVTGAQAYDHWFVQQPSLPRQAFCAKVGVPADRPL